MTKAELLYAYLAGRISRDEFELKAMLQVWSAFEQPNGLYALHRRGEKTYHTRAEIEQLRRRVPRWIVLNVMTQEDMKSDPID